MDKCEWIFNCACHDWEMSFSRIFNKDTTSASPRWWHHQRGGAMTDKSRLMNLWRREETFFFVCSAAQCCMHILYINSIELKKQRRRIGTLNCPKRGTMMRYQEERSKEWANRRTLSEIESILIRSKLHQSFSRTFVLGSQMAIRWHLVKGMQ